MNVPLSKEEKIKISIMYLSGLSIRKISKLVKRDPGTISTNLVKLGIILRTSSEVSRIYPVKEDWFENIDTEEKAYWLGFIYADGCVYKNALMITLAVKDRNHLETFKNILSPSRSLLMNNNRQHPSCCLEIKSKQLTDDLTRHGVLKAKTFKLTALPILEADLVRHFIRGYFDGDGCVTNYITGGYSKSTFNILGTYTFMSNVQNILEKECALTPTNLIKVKTKSDKIFRYLKTSKKQIKNIHEYFYLNSNIYLQRKKEKFEQAIGSLSSNR